MSQSQVSSGHGLPGRVTSAWICSGFWFLLALFGGAAALRLIDAGPNLRYQHYRIGTTTDGDWLLWSVLVLQATAVVVGLCRVARPVGWPLTGISVPRAGFALACIWLTSAIISRELWKYPVELTIATGIQLTALGAIALGVQAMPAVPTRLVALGRNLCEDTEPAPGSGSHYWPVGILAAGMAVAAAALAVMVYERHPHVPDEVSYLLHARYFAAGKLWIQAPPAMGAFSIDLMFYDGARAFSPFPPGWPALLALALRAGVPWLLNPLLAGLNVWLCYLLFLELYPRQVARVGALLVSVSPWHLFLGMSYMAHQATLLCALAAALALARANRHKRAEWLVLSGLSTGVVSLIRPLDSLVVVLIAAPFLFVGHRRAAKLRSALYFAVGFSVAAAPNLPYNAVISGNALEFPVMAYFDRYYWPGSNAMGFGPQRGVGWPLDAMTGHTPLEGVVNTLVNGAQVNSEFLGWTCGSLIGLAALLTVGRLRRVDGVMLTALAIVIGLHFFYWYTGGPDFGARYWYLSLPPLAALTARGIQETERWLTMSLGRAFHGRILFGVCVLVAVALLTFVPWRALNKYRHFRGMSAGVSELAAENRFGESLVFIRGKRHPDYASAAVYNPLDLRMSSGRTLYAWDRDQAARIAAVERFPNRPIWVVNGPTLTGSEFEIAAGPQSGRAFLADSETVTTTVPSANSAQPVRPVRERRP